MSKSLQIDLMPRQPFSILPYIHSFIKPKSPVLSFLFHKKNSGVCFGEVLYIIFLLFIFTTNILNHCELQSYIIHDWVPAHVPYQFCDQCPHLHINLHSLLLVPTPYASSLAFYIPSPPFRYLYYQYTVTDRVMCILLYSLLDLSHWKCCLFSIIVLEVPSLTLSLLPPQWQTSH